MKKIIKLTESDLTRIVTRILKEEKYSEEDLEYINPKTNEKCKIKVAIFKPSAEKGDIKYHGVLVCDFYGNEMVTATLPIVGKSFEEVNDFICKNIKRTYEILDNILDTEEHELYESYENSRYKVIDRPINCRLDFNN